MKKFDLIIVGMGPGGIFCAYEMVKQGRHKNILLIDQGKSIHKRACPIEKAGKCLKCKPFCNITCGFSGAGAFSDGKLLSYHLSQHNKEGSLYLGGNGSSISEDYTREEIMELLSYTDDIYLSFGADSTLHGVENLGEIKKLQNKAKENNIDLIDIPLRHLGTEKAHILYGKIEQHLEESGVQMLFETQVEDIICEGDKIGGAVVKDNASGKVQNLFAEKVVLAVGRKGASWLSDICTKHQIATKTGSVDIGVRYELSNDVMKKVNSLLYEGKFLARPQPYADRVRTFCQNPSGFVSAEVYDNGLTLVNGHSYKERKSNNTNLAILVSHNFTTPFNKPIQYGENVAENVNTLAKGSVLVQRLGDIFAGRRTWPRDLETNAVVPTLTSAVAGDITYALGYRTVTNILNFIKDLDKVVPGFASPENLLYAPEIKFYSNKVIVDRNFETSLKNLYCIGDGGGLTTGLMMASASGIQMARNLKNLTK